MSGGPTAVHISLAVTVGAFSVSALSLFFGYLLIDSGTAGPVSIDVTRGATKVNFFSFGPGVAFGLFGAAIAWTTVKTLIKKG